MNISVTVKPNAKVERVQQIDSTHFKASVKARPREGEANEALVRVLAEYFDLPRSRFKIVRGLTGRNKLINVM